MQENRMRAMAGLVAAAFLAGCAGTGQLSSNPEATDFSLDPLAFRTDGVGFLTPIAATGQEANRVPLAVAFSSSLSDTFADLEVVTLSEVLSSVNRDGLAADYRAMMDDYAATGVLEKETLRRVGEAAGARYLGLLELADFDQGENRRFSIGGLRLLDTKLASIRVSWQIWDSATGAIAWEGTDELHYAYDTGRERPVTFGFVADQAASNLIARIPIGDTVPRSAAAISLTR